MSAPHAVVTGAAGFIGSHVARLLAARGYEIHCVGRGTGVENIGSGSLGVVDARTELVVHCAGGSSVGQSVSDPLADFEKSVPPFAALLEHVRMDAPAAKVVLLSSAAVYGNADELPTTEAAAIRPISPYGHHKRMCEELCFSYGSNYGIQSAVVRLFSVYGAGLRKQLLWDACHKAAAKERKFHGTGLETRDWLHVDDAAALLLTAAAAATPDVTVLNGGSGVATPVATVVRRLFEQMDAEPPEFIGGGRPGDPSRYVADITRARALGWQPQVDLERGLDEYVAWFKARA